MPKTTSAWLEEVAAAYRDARDTIPFGALTGQTITDHDLFHLAPAIALKFRGLKPGGRKLRRVTEAALASYLAGTEGAPEIKDYPHVCFAYCYLASHHALDLVTAEEAEAVIQDLAVKEGKLWQAINA